MKSHCKVTIILLNVLSKGTEIQFKDYLKMVDGYKKSKSIKPIVTNTEEIAENFWENLKNRTSTQYYADMFLLEFLTHIHILVC